MLPWNPYTLQSSRCWLHPVAAISNDLSALQLPFCGPAEDWSLISTTPDFTDTPLGPGRVLASQPSKGAVGRSRPNGPFGQRGSGCRQLISYDTMMALIISK